MKKIALIPALLNSTRVPNKNLMLVDGFPLIYYVIEACKNSNAFDEIYINSDELVFKDMAEQLGVKFYHRDKSRGGTECTMVNNSKDCGGNRCTIHDHFLYDFITNVECDYLVQVHTTSPLLKPETILEFTKTLEDYDSLVTTEQTYSESFMDGNPINFNPKKKQETQSLSPIDSICWAMTGWKKETFMSEYETGPTFCGKFGYFPISKIEAIDVDTMDELYIAEACLNHRKRKENIGKFYYHEGITSIESALVDLIALDGSPMPEEGVLGHNETLMDLDEIEDKLGGSDWCYPVVYTDNDQIAFIKQSKGNGCRKHYHPTKDEWWVIFRGEFEYKLWHNREEPEGEPDEVVIAKPGNLVFLPKGTVHVISCISNEPGVRLACGGKEMAHVYVK
jgi:CMP-N-acetylneuraminic acid synthetase/mannose-6-phosphate isomerase-like protein (cupin superfamily)